MAQKKWKTIVVTALASLGLSASSIPMAAMGIVNAAPASAATCQFKDPNGNTVYYQCGPDDPNYPGGSPYLQVHIQAHLTSGDPASTRWSTALAHLTFELNEQSTTGQSIKDSLNHVNRDLVVFHGTSRVATILESRSNVYFNVDFSALSRVPGFTTNASSLSSLNFLLGDRWIELPSSLVVHYAKSVTGLTLPHTSLSAEENVLLRAVVSLLAKNETTATARGFSETGSLAKLISGLATSLKTLGIPSRPSSGVSGTYTVNVTMSGSNAVAADIKIVAPIAKHGTAVVQLMTRFAHQTVPVVAPTNPLVVTPSLIKQLGSGAGGILSGSLG